MDNIDKNIAPQEQEIDLIELAKKLWKSRKFILKICGISLLVALVIAFSLPKEYTTTVMLAPEVNNSQSGGGMGALAAMAGVNLQQNSGGELPVELYPDVVTSTPFLMGLFEVRVQDQQRKIDTSLYTYLKENQRKAWWSSVLNAPFKLLGLFLSKKEDNKVVQDTLNSRVIVLSKKQQSVLFALKNRIHGSVDKKTGAIILSSTMQSPKISAAIADTIISYMQEHILDYRTQKARQDLIFTEQLYREAQENYYKAQKILSTYMDENMGIVSARYRNTQDRLQNEANLTFGVYNQMAQQLQMAKMKVQDTTPVYTIIQPAVVPLRAESPRKMMILIGCIFLAFVGSCGWILFNDSVLASLKK